jgi:multiple sugar transport system substrate-binding protein
MYDKAPSRLNESPGGAFCANHFSPSEFIQPEPLQHYPEKNMSKAKLFILAVAVGSVVTAQSAFREPKYPKIESGQVTLEIWSWVNGIDKVAKGFEAVYPNVKIHVTNPGAGNSGLYPKLQTALKAGTGAPDVAQVEMDYLPGFVEAGGLEDMSKYGADKYKSYFVPWTWGQVSPTGKGVYAIPQDSGPFAMVYNKSVFDKYGLKVPKTWAEYATTAEKLDKASGSKVKMGNFFTDQAAWFTALVWASGGSPWKRGNEGWTQSLDGPEATKVAQFWGDLVNKGQVGTIKSFSAEWWTALGNGDVATSMEAAWGPGFIAGSVDKKANGALRVAALPQWTAGGKIATGNWGGSSMVVTSQSKFPLAATAFSIWINASKEAVVGNWKGQALFPAATAGLALPELHDTTTNPSAFFGKQDLMKVYAVAAKGVNTDFVWAPWLQKVNANYGKQFDAAARANSSFVDALKKWQTETLALAQADGYTVRGR